MPKTALCAIAYRQRPNRLAFNAAKARSMCAFRPELETLKTSGNAWWARQDSNLQPDRYERPALPGEINKIRTFSSCSVTFVHVRSRGFCGRPVVGIVRRICAEPALKTCGTER